MESSIVSLHHSYIFCKPRGTFDGFICQALTGCLTIPPGNEACVMLYSHFCYFINFPLHHSYICCLSVERFDWLIFSRVELLPHSWDNQACGYSGANITYAIVSLVSSYIVLRSYSETVRSLTMTIYQRPQRLQAGFLMVFLLSVM